MGGAFSSILIGSPVFPRKTTSLFYLDCTAASTSPTLTWTMVLVDYAPAMLLTGDCNCLYKLISLVPANYLPSRLHWTGPET